MKTDEFQIVKEPKLNIHHEIHTLLLLSHACLSKKQGTIQEATPRCNADGFTREAKQATVWREKTARGSKGLPSLHEGCTLVIAAKEDSTSLNRCPLILVELLATPATRLIAASNVI